MQLSGFRPQRPFSKILFCPTSGELCTVSSRASTFFISRIGITIYSFFPSFLFANSVNIFSVYAQGSYLCTAALTLYKS